MAADQVGTVESAHTIGRTFGRGSRVEALPRAGPRRCWTVEQKLSIVGEAFVTDKLRDVNDGEFGPVTQVHIALNQNLNLEATRLTLIAARAHMTKQSMLELVDKAEAVGSWSAGPIRTIAGRRSWHSRLAACG